MEINAQTTALEQEAHVQHGSPARYVKIWAILLVLLSISIAGPSVGIRAVTLFTAFGIAIIKALIVASEFMHLKYEKKFVVYMLLSMLFLMLIFFYGVAPDVMMKGGTNWQKNAPTYTPPPLEETR